MNRRNFLIGAGATIGTFMASPVLALGSPLSFHNIHTNETLNLAIGADYMSVVRFFRDFRTGDFHDMDGKLFELLDKINIKTGNSEPYKVISAYRSPKTNNALRAEGSGVAKKSFHLKGMALDISKDTIGVNNLASLAKEFEIGGVGAYPKSGFVHIDTGPVRSW